MVQLAPVRGTRIFGDPSAGEVEQALSRAVPALPALQCPGGDLYAELGRGSTRLLGGLAGYLAGAASMAVVAGVGRTRVFPDVLAHPLAGTDYSALIIDSLVRRRRGTLLWKGRPVVGAHAETLTPGRG